MVEISSVSREMEHKTACKRKPWLLDELLRLGSEHSLDLVKDKRHFALIFKSQNKHYLTDGAHSIKAIFPRPPTEVFPTAVYILSYDYYITVSVNDYQCGSFFLEVEFYRPLPCSFDCLDNADRNIKINSVPEIKQVLFHCLIRSLPYPPMVFYYDDAEENLSVLTNLVRESHKSSSPPSPTDQQMSSKPFTALRHHHGGKEDIQISNSQNVRARSKILHHPKSAGRDGKANFQPSMRKRYKTKTQQESGGDGSKTETLVGTETQEEGLLSPSQNNGDSQGATDKSAGLSTDRLHKSFHNSLVKFTTECNDSSESLFTDSEKSMKEDKEEKSSLKDAPQSSCHSPRDLCGKVCPNFQENIDCTSTRRDDSKDFHQEKKLTEKNVSTLKMSINGSIGFCSENDNSKNFQQSMSEDSSLGGSESLFSDSSQEDSENEGGTLEVSASSSKQKEFKQFAKEGENEERRTMSATESVIFQGNLTSGFSSSSSCEKSQDFVAIKNFTEQRKCGDDTEKDNILNCSPGFEVPDV